MQRLHHGHAGAFGGADHRWAEQQQRIVNVHSIDVLCFYNVFYIPGSGVVPHGMQGQQGLGQTVGGFLVAALIHDDRPAADNGSAPAEFSPRKAPFCTHFSPEWVEMGYYVIITFFGA